MPKWVVICPKCKTEFKHSQIDDVGMAWLILPEKPVFPPCGNTCVCPNCRAVVNYHATDLQYRD